MSKKSNLKVADLCGEVTIYYSASEIDEQWVLTKVTLEIKAEKRSSTASARLYEAFNQLQNPSIKEEVELLEKLTSDKDSFRIKTKKSTIEELQSSNIKL